MAAGADEAPWIQADLGSIKVLARIATQGRNLGGDFVQFVRTYSISSSYGNDFEFVLNEDGSEKVFIGNRNMNSVVWNCLGLLQARYVKLHLCTKMDVVSGVAKPEPAGIPP